MELHTLGVDGGYTQKDVQEVARAFTGWTIAQPAPGRRLPFEPRMHDDGEKIVLGHKIKAGGGQKRRRAGARHPGRASGDGAVHRHQAGAALRRRRRRRRRSSIAPRRVPRDRRRHPRGGAHDRHVAGVLRRRRLSREGEDAVRVRRRARCARPASTSANALPLVQAVRELGMPLYMLPAADRLRRQRRRVGQHRRAAQPHELRGCAASSGRMRGVGTRRRASRRERPRERARATTCWPTTSRVDTATVAQGDRRRAGGRAAARLPEFQRR